MMKLISSRWIIFLLSFLCSVYKCQGQETTLPQSQNQNADSSDDIALWRFYSVDSPETKINLDGHLENVVKTAGEKLSLDCEITGYPRPSYRWFKDGALILEGNGVSIRFVDWGNRLRINSLKTTDTGVYTCTGENIKGQFNTSAHVRVKSAPVTDPPEQPRTTPAPDVTQDTVTTKSDKHAIQPYCQDYIADGNYCGFLKTEEIYVTSRGAQDLASRSLIAMVTQLNEIDVPPSSQCFQKSVEAMCYYEMPLCTRGVGTNPATPHRLCRDECTRLYSICNEYFDKNVLNWRLLPTCEALNNEPGCVKIGVVPEPVNPYDNKKDVSEDELKDLAMTIILPVGLGLLVVIGIVVTFVCVCRKKRNTRTKSPLSINGRLTGSEKGTELASVSDKQSFYMKDIPIDNVHFLQELGEGDYGKVFKGQVFGLYGNGTASTVFIKTLREKAAPGEQKLFQDEMGAMTEVRHQHILSLLGVSVKGIPQCMLYEYLPLGDLHQFLLSQDAHNSSLQHKEIMYVATQIASGMEYLATQNYIHKDIAARNIIVSHNLNVKISNLCMTLGLHSSDYYQLHGKLMPIRWLPPETITYGKFTLDSDIFSYGVLMWEVFSSSMQPYAGLSNQEVVEMVRSRQLLPCPSSCPPRLYSLMMECWHEKPSKRPTAKEVHQKMRAWYLDNTNMYAMSSTTGQSVPSVSTSTAPSHHSSTGPSNPSNQTNLTGVGSNTSGDPMSPVPLQQQAPYMQPAPLPIHTETPPYYSSLYPANQCQQNHNIRPDSPISRSLSSIEDDDDESEYTVPCQPHSQPPIINQFASLNRKPRDVRVDYRGQNQPFLPQDHV